jgi:hypothetical protein
MLRSNNLKLANALNLFKNLSTRTFASEAGATGGFSFGRRVFNTIFLCIM